MMGYEDTPQEKLFYYGVNLEERVRPGHILRKIAKAIEFDFVYKELKDKYGSKGNVSIPPPVTLKLMLLLVLYNVRSERELMETLPERLDWLWFLGYDLDSRVPDHSVLSKARKRWGTELFRKLFEMVVWKCVEGGLVDGRKIFMDSSIIDANASNNSVIDRFSFKDYTKGYYVELEKRLDNEVNDRYISSTDEDASIVNRGGKAKLRYQTHRAVDGKYEVITSAEVRPGVVNEAHMLGELLEKHQEHTGIQAETVVADSKYGTIANYLECRDRGVEAHMPDLKEKQSKLDKISDKEFIYDKDTDTYTCPAGNQLRKGHVHAKRNSVDYGGHKKTCKGCELREKCTENKKGRTIKRHLRQDALDEMRERASSYKSKRDIRTRQHLMERSFARSKRYGYDRARWRGSWRVQIQEYLVTIVQNLDILAHFGKRNEGAALSIEAVQTLRTITTLMVAYYLIVHWPKVPSTHVPSQLRKSWHDGAGGINWE
jgi:transposase